MHSILYLLSIMYFWPALLVCIIFSLVAASLAPAKAWQQPTGSLSQTICIVDYQFNVGGSVKALRGPEGNPLRCDRT